jgi:hypothetical protein
MRPLARKENVTIRELPEETLVYDLERHAMHCLNRTAALVWKHCDGRHDAAALAALVAREIGLPADEAAAAAGLALEQLGRRKLLQEAVAPVEGANRLSRRSALRKMAVAATAALPLVMTLKSPSIAWGRTTVNGCIDDSGCPAGQTCEVIHLGPHNSMIFGTCISGTTTTTTTTTTRPPVKCGQLCATAGPAGCNNVGCTCVIPAGQQVGTCQPI